MICKYKNRKRQNTYFINSYKFFRPSGMTLEKAVEEAQLAINYFFNNKFDEAKSLMKP